MNQIAHVASDTITPIASPPPEAIPLVDAEDAGGFNPITLVLRLMRGRWIAAILCAVAVAGVLGAVGYRITIPKYETKVIMRVAASGTSILYADADTSRLKLFDDFVRSEATFLASRPVLARAAAAINAERPEGTPAHTALSLSHAIEVQRKNSLLILTTQAKAGPIAAEIGNAVLVAYQRAHAERSAGRAEFRESELARREVELLERLKSLNARILEVGGEYGSNSLAKAHIGKVAAIEALESRRDEVRAQIASIEAKTASADVDTGDDRIKRAIVLDRSLADLSFEKAKREAELAATLVRASERHPPVVSMRAALDVIDEAIAARRDQIVTLARTGALKDAEGSTEQGLAEIKQVLVKVDANIVEARAAARSLNAKRVELNFLDEERIEVRRLLDETRRALDVIRVESRNALPGIVEVISDASVPLEPSDDKRLILAAGGVIAGGGVVGVLFLGFGFFNSRLRFSDDLGRTAERFKLLATLPQTTPRRRAERADAARMSEPLGAAADKIRTAIQLFPVRAPSPGERGRVIVVTGAGESDPADLSTELAASFAGSGLSTRLIDADIESAILSKAFDAEMGTGFRELLAGRHEQGPRAAEVDGGERPLLVPAGTLPTVNAGSVSLGAVRSAVNRLSQAADVVLIHAGSERNALLRDLLASQADLAIVVVECGGLRRRADRCATRLDALTRNGVALVFQNALPNDPGLND